MAFLNETGLTKLWTLCTQKFLGKSDDIALSSVKASSTDIRSAFNSNSSVTLDNWIDVLLYSPAWVNSFYPYADTSLSNNMIEWNGDTESFVWVSSNFMSSFLNTTDKKGVSLGGTDINPITVCLAKENSEGLADSYKKAFSFTFPDDYSTASGPTITLANSSLTALSSTIFDSNTGQGDGADVNISKILQTLFSDTSLGSTSDSHFWVKMMWGVNYMPLTEYRV